MADSYIFDTDISNATFYSGDDVITLNGKLAYKDGWDTRGEDRIWAGEGDDTITLNGGGDRINANGHVWDTFVEGEDGDDKIYLRGADKTYGGVYGGKGNCVVVEERSKPKGF